MVDFIEKVKKSNKFIFIIEDSDIERLFELTVEYTNALTKTAKHFKGNSLIANIDFLIDVDVTPTQYVLSITEIEATPAKYAKYISSLIARRVLKQFRTLLPVTDKEILFLTFKDTPLITYIKKYGVIIKGGKNE